MPGIDEIREQTGMLRQTPGVPQVVDDQEIDARQFCQQLVDGGVRQLLVELVQQLLGIKELHRERDIAWLGAPCFVNVESDSVLPASSPTLPLVLGMLACMLQHQRGRCEEMARAQYRGVHTRSPMKVFLAVPFET